MAHAAVYPKHKNGTPGFVCGGIREQYIATQKQYRRIQKERVLRVILRKYPISKRYSRKEQYLYYLMKLRTLEIKPVGETWFYRLIKGLKNGR